MNIDSSTIKKIAHLARLEFDESKTEEMVNDMKNIITWMEKLGEVNTDNVEPLRHMSAEVNVLREDVENNSLSHEDALFNAPKKDSDYFRVPKVIE